MPTTTRQMSTIVCDCLESGRAICAQESTDDICVVCQEALPDDCPATVKLRCGHTFHGQCLVNHLLNDVRCPICRYSPYYHPPSEDEEDEMPYVSRKQALDNAKKAASNTKQGKKVKQSLATLAKWRKRDREARKEWCAMQRALDAKEEVEVYDVINKHETRIQDRFNRIHKAELDAIKDAAATMKKVRGYYQNTRTRIAKKFGYVGRHRRSSHRRLRVTNPDDMDEFANTHVDDNSD